ncbi:hypothetical protein BH24DEI2_BH24DEI2_21380 [soil metagenome]
MPNFTSEHALLTGIMIFVILSAVVTISLVMLWAPSRPFPGYKGDAAKPGPKQSTEKKLKTKQKR